MSGPLVPAPPASVNGPKRLERLRNAVPEAADLALVGDSLAAGFPDDALRAALPGWRVLNFGLAGDRVQNTLWRLGAVDLSHLAPRAAVTILGTNNLGDGDPAEDVAAGLALVASRLAGLWPRARLVLLTVPWRAERPGYDDRERRRLNGLLASGAAPGVEVLDADAALHGAPADPPGLDPDGLHLSAPGYRRLARRLAEHLGGAGGALPP